MTPKPAKSISKHRLLPALWGIIIILLCLPLQAASLDISNEYPDPVGKHIEIYQEDNKPLDLAAAQAVYQAGEFQGSDSDFLSLGIGTQPVWLRLVLSNRSDQPLKRRISIENSWLDKIDIYLLHDSSLLQHTQMGDRLPYSQRGIKNRFFSIDQNLPPGDSQVYIRIATPDPMVLPVYVSSIDAAYQRGTFDHYSYGFLYGVILALAAYNLMLFFSLRSVRYLYYFVYLGTFLLLNLAYTGHAYMWLWPEAPDWQRWANPVLMVLFSVSGILFASRFLNSRQFFPRLHRGIIYLTTGFALAEALAVLGGWHEAALLVAFSFIFIFSGIMILLGIVSLKAGDRSAKYFLLASVTHACAASITATVVWGIMPYSLVGYRAVEIGMMIDAVLLAMALAHQFRIIQQDKLKAERLAQVDPLTNINNRRAFYEIARPIWDNGLRKQHPMSIILLDIDHFKKINDDFGHPQGDEVLVQLAKLLKTGTRSGDILARWGGEEFIFFLPETRLDEAIIIAERFRTGIANTHIANGAKHISLSVSMGVAQLKKTDTTLDDLISAADKYLYLAKEEGRDRVCAGHY